MTLEIIKGKNREMLSSAAFSALLNAYARCHIDIGTGAGLYPLRRARLHTDELVIGLDADRDSLMEGAQKAVKKPQKGGAPNALFVCANALNLPPLLQTPFADTFSIQFPWASLLDAVVLPDAAFLKSVRALCKKGARGDIYINIHAVNDHDTLKTAHLPEVNRETVQSHLRPAWEAAGFTWLEDQFYAPGAMVDVASKWGGRLTRGSARPTVYFQVEAV